MKNPVIEDFYVVAQEPGAENPAIPTWACAEPNPADLDPDYATTLIRREIVSVPGAFQLLNVLSTNECVELIKITESLGYLKDAAVSLPRTVRHNDNITWVADDLTNQLIWQRCQPLMRNEENLFFGKQAVGLNSRFRFYRYSEGDYFSPHTDGSWPGSRIVDGKLVENAYSDCWSQLSFLLFLSDDYEGGSTQFYVNKEDPKHEIDTIAEQSIVNIRSPIGTALCFPHGMHPLHCLHSSEEITAGTKYIIRSDVLFEL